MAQALLSELHRRGIRLRLVDDRLDVVAPAGSLTAELREQLKAQRDQLVALLRRSEAGGEDVRVVPRPDLRHEPFPLTDIQQAYWIGRSSAIELGGVSTHYYFELDGEGLDVCRLTDALNAVIARHDMLRAVVQPDGLQRVLPDVPRYEIAVADLTALGDADREQALLATRAELGAKTPEPDAWPLFEIRASLLGGGRHRLHLSFNILIIDFFSLALLFHDWRQAYENPGQRLPEPGVFYRDYIAAQQELRSGPGYAQAEAYWLGRLAELPNAPELPLAKQPAQLESVEFVRRQGRLPREQWDAVKAAARRRGLTPSVALMAAFSDVLRLWSGGQRDFTLNLTLFDRPPLHPAIGEIIGDFTSLTMLAVQEPAPDETFADRALRLGGQLLRDLGHTAYSGLRVLRERARSLSSGLGAAMPIVVTSAIGSAPQQDQAGDRGFFGRLGYGISQTPQVWVDHQIMEEFGDLLYNWDCVDALFPDRLLDDMFGSYHALLERLAADEGAWDDPALRPQLPGWQEAERDAANATALRLPGGTLCGLAEEQARRAPDAVAVIAGDTQLTYRQLTAHANRLARRLLECGARRDNLVGIVLERGWEQVAATLGVTASGAAYLPVDPSWPQARRSQVLELGGVQLVVTSPQLRDSAQWPAGVQPITLEDAEVRTADDGPLDAGPEPTDLAYVIFTSGSTGTPKGVMIDHRGAVNTVQDINRRFGVGPADRVLALSSLSFDLSVYDVFGTLAAGAAVVVPPAAGARDPQQWTELMDRHGVTVWNSVPALMQAWVDAGGRTAAGSLRTVLLSGDWIPVGLPDAIRAAEPRARVISLGGATEASIWSVCYPVGAVPPEWVRIPYGKPLANQTLHVYNAAFEPCPVWTAGDIYIGGTGVAKGYWADPQRTAASFVTHPRTGERLYRTGDLGRYLPGGDIEFLGRQDSQVKLNGYRIELGEITAALRRLPGVAEGLVRVDANPVTGARQLVAYVVGAPGSEPDTETVRAALAAALPDYMVPQHYLLIDTVPLSANGKVDVSALPTAWSEPDQEAVEGPRDDLEERLLAIWREVLQRDDFGVLDNLFEMGADSLHAVRILTRLRDDLGIATEGDEGLRLLFESPTVTELAAELRKQVGAPA
ncbi:non-ribosomal peptide synthetase [Actinacidiphila epipremni]|uniref:Phenyloxazoline synthase MbtB n=1 Tax=Actinacidiphila epipremni TaxID=2053013 RepID=A0ABX0ZN90_9ACTN|nr:non-ribosomal peptide synthetase [Actinacidiphila epipremni]NJP45310.1 amino acid adenylation domain-containing protein [Actinacidiphila epipremni]